MTRLPLLCAGGCFLSLGLLIPAIPVHVTGVLGQGPASVGACLAVTAVCAVLARPLAGRLADRRSRRFAAAGGAALLALTSGVVPWTGSMPSFLACRAVAGVGEALMYVGLAAAASDHDRPGPALNGFSVAVNAGLLAGAPMAAAVAALAGPPAVWAVSAAVAAVAFAACLFLPGARDARDGAARDRDARDGAAASRERRRAGTGVHMAGLVPGLAYWASVWGYTAFSAFLPLHLAALGGGSGPHFLVYGCVLLAVRVGGHRALARIPARRTATAALLLTAAGLVMFVAWPTVEGALCATAVLAAGQALGLPAFLTMAVTGVPAGQRGSAVATTTAFFDLGFLSAALALGAVAQSHGLAQGFAVAACVAGLAPLLLSLHPEASRRRTS
ncbi:MFS transporter [Nonomuraea wenchangensis]|uniref:Predicted arabinose efflux permease, MFS family n=1 Tax=Nonomuraea wenchangensis TaxID=568860 RepID=A0A1I0LTM4_9ACTN|nr:MFS transporter [Nonomuraea wenchangensis]SEU45461.1 Predicted arabinose efflux permease, MFS family [Nonomuraea wenchangensis]